MLESESMSDHEKILISWASMNQKEVGRLRLDFLKNARGLINWNVSASAISAPHFNELSLATFR